ncbi:MAG: DegT/DnrJ/EryC1/StrS family aminotransferase [Bacteroidota bacterium]
MTTALQPIPMVDLKNQYLRIKPEIDAAIESICHSSQFIGGSTVKAFAEDLAHFLDAKWVIPCGNGTDALQLALMACGLEAGDEVITTPFTFISTAEVIALLNLKPVFVDIKPDTFQIDVDLIEAAISPRTKCIIPVHLFGQMSDMSPIMQLAEQYKLWVIEDNAQAIGAEYLFPDGKRRKAGTIGHIGTTSFFPSKNLGCYGDGGALFTNDDALAEKIRMFGNHGMKVRYYHDAIGVNSRLDAIQAAILGIKLRHLNDYNKARQRAANVYDELLEGLAGVETPFRAPYSTHVFHQYTLKVQGDRDQIKDVLGEHQIASGIYYPVPIHLQNAYAKYGYQPGDLPVSEQLARKVLSLPIHTEWIHPAQYV